MYSVVKKCLLGRARRELLSPGLYVDYYRIRRNYFFPFPLERIPEPFDYQVDGVKHYPWNTWWAWALEERIHALMYAYQIEPASDFLHAAEKNLQEIATLLHPEPTEIQRRYSHLCYSHIARLFTQAKLEWKNILSADTQSQLEKAVPLLLHHLSDELTGYVNAVENPDSPASERLQFNIPLITLTSMAALANVYQHPLASELSAATHFFTTRWSDAIMEGFLEGICYEGYVRYFSEIFFASEKTPRPALTSDEAFRMRTHFLGTPNDPSDVALIGDVEPNEMPFYLTAFLRQSSVQKNSLYPWKQVPSHRLRTETLHLLISHFSCTESSGFAAHTDYTPTSPLDLGYAIRLSPPPSHPWVTLIARHASPAGHLPPDLGQVTVANASDWIIADPGYQQYIPNSERIFSFGKFAHNTPVIHDHYIAAKPTLPELSQTFTQTNSTPSFQSLTLDLTSAYPASSSPDNTTPSEILNVTRQIFQPDFAATIIIDSIKLSRPLPIDFYWHSSPPVFWHQIPDASCPTCLLSSAEPEKPDVIRFSAHASLAPSHYQVTRLKGSRGQLTFHLQFHAESLRVLWYIAPTTSPDVTTVEFLESGVKLDFADGRAARL